MNEVSMSLDEREFSEAPRPNNDAYEMELRGYELARKVGDRWVQTAHYRPTTQGWRQAMSDGKWLQERHPQENYKVRPIVSMKAPEPIVKEVTDAEVG